MKRTIALATLAVILTAVASAQPLVKPFPFIVPSNDSSRSEWLPAMPAGDVDGRGFLVTLPDGHFGWSDSTRARLVGASVIASACFPDSIAAIAAAAHLRKLGVNIVRFVYFDYHNSDGASTLAPGTRSDTLSTSQMKRLDWFLAQLKRNGIRAHFVVKARNAPRRDDAVPTWDSASNYGQYLYYFSEPLQAMQRRYMTKLFSHVNPYTGMRYGDDPEIALVTVVDQNSIFDNWINDRVNQRSGYLSFNQSRLVDTMFAGFLRKRYGTTAALTARYWEGIHTLGPNTVKNPGFESYTDNWTLTVGEGATASPVIVQGPDVAPGFGPNTLRVAIRSVNGNETRIYLEQAGVKVRKYAIYHLRFLARTDSAGGRPVHLVLMRGSTPFDNLGLNETLTLTNQWQTFDFTFRSLGTDTLATLLRFYLGKQMGDVFLDGFTLEETGRQDLAPGEALETSTIIRTRFRDVAKVSLARMYDLVDFYDSLGRAYYRNMSAHLHSLGVKAPIAGTNQTASPIDSWGQSEYDFTSETSQWDFTGTRTGMPSSDSTWVIRNYSVLRFRDQKIPEFSRGAQLGKPFIAEQYSHIFPNAHRSEMMLFMPSYASLHDWDGMYLYCYSDRSSEMADRRRVFKDDYTSFIADASVTALLPQVSDAMRNGWIAPAERMVRIQHDVADLRYLPITYSSRGFYDIDGTFQSVINLVTAIRIDSFAAARHYTADDYYVTIPTDDNIQSDTRQITLDMTKGVLQLNAPRIQGGAGALSSVASIRTDNLGVSWIDGGANVTYLWSTLDGRTLDSAQRSLLTITTRSGNTGAIWQFGDSSLGKNWGAAPLLFESVKLGVNFYTAADSVVLHPLDTVGRPTGRVIPATRNTSGAWRVTLDLETEATPWFGVEQMFGAPPDTGVSGVRSPAGTAAAVGAAYPNPASDFTTVDLVLPRIGAIVGARVVDMLGRTVLVVPEHAAAIHAAAAHVALDLDVRALAAGTYVALISVDGTTSARRFVVRR